MDRSSYQESRKTYRQREDLSSLCYSGRTNHRYKFAKEENSLSFGMSFRLRLIICMIIFLSFLFVDHFIWEEKESKIIYQKIEEDVPVEKWKTYGLNILEEMKKYNPEK